MLRSGKQREYGCVVDAQRCSSADPVISGAGRARAARVDRLRRATLAHPSTVLSVECEPVSTNSAGKNADR
jgi:hypothetical protein